MIKIFLTSSRPHCTALNSKKATEHSTNINPHPTPVYQVPRDTTLLLGEKSLLLILPQATTAPGQAWLRPHSHTGGCDSATGFHPGAVGTHFLLVQAPCGRQALRPVSSTWPLQEAGHHSPFRLCPLKITAPEQGTGGHGQ